MKRTVQIPNRCISQLVDEHGVIDALKKFRCNERLSFIDEAAMIGEGTEIYFFTHIYGPAKIGKNCLIGSHITIQGSGTQIGNNVRVGDFTFIPAQTIIEDNVFVSQHVSICNDSFPKSGNKNWKVEPVIIRDGASIGSGVVLLPGVEIGKNALIGAGAVVTKNVPDGQIWIGKPARQLKKK